MITSGARHRGQDHFEPEPQIDPHEQRLLPRHLEQIDYTAFVANRETLAKAIGRIDIEKFQRLAVATAQARARWIAVALSTTETNHAPHPEQGAELATLRQSFEELMEVYEALRRAVERGYLHFETKA
jgi:hypothetical protein